jgi:hypothetical protein
LPRSIGVRPSAAAGHGSAFNRYAAIAWNGHALNLSTTPAPPGKCVPDASAGAVASPIESSAGPAAKSRITVDSRSAAASNAGKPVRSGEALRG